MSRSIHDTTGVWERAGRDDYADPEVPKAIQAEMKKNWLRQQAIRESERRLRKGGQEPAPVDPDQVPILVEDEAPYVFHPASEEDIRAVLRRLPRGSIDGLVAIRLRVDLVDARGGQRVRDPFTGRLRREVLPGVFHSSFAGIYTRSTATIELYAKLCDPHALGPFAIYFKAQALRTLVHEAAHHFDNTFRKKRNRWDVRDKNELWAERIEDEQAKSIVAPYLAERYRAECRALTAWCKEHGGAELSPIHLVLVDDACTAFLSLVWSVHEGRDRDDNHVEFARALHQAGGHDLARDAVQSVLATKPDDAGALAVSACIASCADHAYDTAESLCERAIASDPTCLEAWEVLVRSFATQSKWTDVARVGERAISHIPVGDRDAYYIVETLTHAHFLVGDWKAVEEDVGRMRAWGFRWADLDADLYGALGCCWREHWEEGLLLASKLLATGKHEDGHLWLLAARFECAHRLGHAHEAGAFNAADMARLQKHSFTRTWAGRIREHIPAVAQWGEEPAVPSSGAPGD